MNVSPYNYFQERYSDDPWKVLVVCMMLNQTSGKQVERVHEEFFKRWSSPMLAALGSDVEMAEVLRPLGFYNRRAKAIQRMSFEYLNKKWNEPSDLYGVGKYGSDSYNIFIRKVIPEGVTDKELRKYIEWLKESEKDVS